MKFSAWVVMAVVITACQGQPGESVAKVEPSDSASESRSTASLGDGSSDGSDNPPVAQNAAENQPTKNESDSSPDGADEPPKALAPTQTESPGSTAEPAAPALVPAATPTIEPAATIRPNAVGGSCGPNGRGMVLADLGGVGYCCTVDFYGAITMPYRHLCSPISGPPAPSVNPAGTIGGSCGNKGLGITMADRNGNGYCCNIDHLGSIATPYRILCSPSAKLPAPSSIPTGSLGASCGAGGLGMALESNGGKPYCCNTDPLGAIVWPYRLLCSDNP